MNREQCAGALQYFDILLVEGMSSELGAVDFIFGERRKVDEADGVIGGSAEIGRDEISENLAAAFAYGICSSAAYFVMSDNLLGSIV
jgi:hypothetical protein